VHHFVVAVHFVAVVRTAGAHLGTGPAGKSVEVRAAQHEVGAGLADLHAITHQTDVVGLGVLAALAKTMLHCPEADLMALRAIFDALVHLRRGVFCHGLHRGNELQNSHRAVTPGKLAAGVPKDAGCDSFAKTS
jgi:hypothetical protein